MRVLHRQAPSGRPSHQGLAGGTAFGSRVRSTGGRGVKVNGCGAGRGQEDPAEPWATPREGDEPRIHRLEHPRLVEAQSWALASTSPPGSWPQQGDSSCPPSFARARAAAGSPVAAAGEAASSELSTRCAGPLRDRRKARPL